MAQLFGVGVPGISKHLAHIFEEGELSKDTTVSKMEIVVNRGFRGEIPEQVEFYSLDDERLKQGKAVFGKEIIGQ